MDHRVTTITLAQAGLKGLYPTLFSCIDTLAESDDAHFTHRFAHFVADLERDFLMEEKWMEDLGFFSLREHREQHAELLRLLHHAQARVADGDFKLGRKIVALLPPWFTHHISAMDLSWASAAHINQKQQSQTVALLEAA